MLAFEYNKINVMLVTKLFIYIYYDIEKKLNFQTTCISEVFINHDIL